MKYRIIIGKKSQGDRIVTNTYLHIIKAACELNGCICEEGTSTEDLNKQEDWLIFDECKLAFLYLIKGYKNVIIWVQGIVPEEAFMKGYSYFRYMIYSMLENYVLRKAQIVFLCSEYMNLNYEKKYKISLLPKAIVMPCYNDTKIDEKGFTAEKYDSNTFVYVGSLSIWQCFEETVSIYKKIELASENQTKLFIFTEEIDKAQSMINLYKVSNYEINYIPKNNLGERLNRIKYGFVLRQDHEVNRVATPTKLSNYISHGIIPIYSPCLYSFDHYNNNDKIAIRFDLDKSEKGINDILKHMQTPINTNLIKDWSNYTFKSYYGAENYVKIIAEHMKSHATI